MWHHNHQYKKNTYTKPIYDSIDFSSIYQSPMVSNHEFTNRNFCSPCKTAVFPIHLSKENSNFDSTNAQASNTKKVDAYSQKGSPIQALYAYMCFDCWPLVVGEQGGIYRFFNILEIFDPVFGPFFGTYYRVGIGFLGVF